MNLQILEPDEPRVLERKSSIYQHGDLLSVMKRGEWCPIVFDTIDGISCGKIKSHKIAIGWGNGLGYTMPVKTCRYLSDTYLTYYKDEIVEKPLPSYYGLGMYEDHIRERVVTNIGDQALGVRQETILRIGEDYFVSTDMLASDDAIIYNG